MGKGQKSEMIKEVQAIFGWVDFWQDGKKESGRQEKNEWEDGKVERRKTHLFG